MAKKKNQGPVNVQFADKYEGCQVVANIMGLNVETVRKRAKAGKLPGKQNDKGTWVFVHADLVKAGIHPFSSAGVAVAPPTGPLPIPKREKNVTDVFFVLDRSGSMAGLMAQARENLAQQIKQLRDASGPNDQYNVTVINFDASITTTVQGVNVVNLWQDAGSLYLYANGSTRLYDAILEAISQAKVRDDGKQAFLISIVTDGEENASKAHLGEVANAVRQVTNSDRFTFAFAGPAGSQHVAGTLGIPAGNVTTWEQSYLGVTTLGITTNNALNTYTATRSAGVMKSVSFYAQPTTLDASKFAGQLDDKLDDVSKAVKVERVTASDPEKIDRFCTKKFGSFEKGKCFYQLTESEKVQDYKKVIIQDTTTGTFYSGWGAAKKLLGIPEFKGTVRIKPGSLGDFKVFVQSTSLNRKLVPGTAVVYLP